MLTITGILRVICWGEMREVNLKKGQKTLLNKVLSYNILDLVIF